MTLNAWHKGTVYAADTETTGVSTETDRVVTACVLRITPPSTIYERNWLVNPGVDIPDGASAIHGITTEKATAEGMAPSIALMEIVDTLRQAWTQQLPIVGMNLIFDLTLLDHELTRHQLGSLAEHGGPGLIVDVLTLDRMLRPSWRGKRKLADLAGTYDVKPGEAHAADGDALTAARVAYRMAQVFPDHFQRDLAELQDLQAIAHRECAEEFGAYLASVGRADDVERSWPYRPASSRKAIAS